MPIQYRTTLMDQDPVASGGFNTTYVHSTPTWAGFPTFNDADCTVPRLWDVAGEMVQPVVMGSFTNAVTESVGALQLRWVAHVDDVVGSGCNLEQGYNVYATKWVDFDGQQPVSLMIQGTGVNGVATFICPDGFRDSFPFSGQGDLPSHDEYLQDPESSLMLSIELIFPF